jgi:hypothetical protein
MKSMFFILFFVISFGSWQEKPKSDIDKVIDHNTKFLDSVKLAKEVDDEVKRVIKNALFDTVGLSSAPVKVLTSKFVNQEYSSYKSVRLTWKNISGKRIEAVKFKWYGEDAFGEPAEMGGSVVAGFGGGYDDDPLGPGKTKSGTWEVLSPNGKKIVKAWPIEVVFANGSKWKLNQGN